MKKRYIIYLVAPIFMLAVEARAQSSSSGGTGRAARFGDQYQLLLDRNIFSKYRTRSDGGSSSRSYRDRSSDYSSRYSRQQYILTGIVKEEGAYHAFIEDTRSNATTRYSVGQELGQGKITAIDVNAIKFGNGTDNQVIEIGMSLDGKVASFVYIPTTLPSASAAGGATTNPTEGAAPAGTGAAPASGGANDIIERMKRARMQETKQ